MAPSQAFNWGPADSFSIEVWVKTATTPSGNDIIIGRGTAASDMFWWVGVNDSGGEAVFYLREDGGSFRKLIGTTVITDNAWHHVVAVRKADTDEHFLYVDGNLETVTSTESGTIDMGFGSSANLQIGYTDGDFYFTGLIDELALYNRALSSSDVTSHFTTGDGGQSLTVLRPEPTANATTTTPNVFEGATVTLDGTGSSTYTGATITGYQWSQTDTTGITATLSDATASQPTFTAPAVTASTTLSFSLTVTASDGQTSSTPATVNVAVADSTAPTANAGADQSVTEGDTVTLDGSASRCWRGGGR